MSQLPPRLQQWLDDINADIDAMTNNGIALTVAMARERLALLTEAFVTDIPSMPYIMTQALPLMPTVRIYHPLPQQALPVLVYFHGGGHMAGGIKEYDPICRKLAFYSQHIVVSVGYRLAPEHPYPAAIEDGEAVLLNVFDRLASLGCLYSPRLVIAGDSAGGALCATLAHRFQTDDRLTISKQILIYPSLDYTLSFPSVTEKGKGYLLQHSRIEWYFSHYFQHNENRHQVSPLWGKYSAALPETLVISAGFCPLKDEAYAYVLALKQQGVATQHLHFQQMIHAFLNLEALVPEECLQTYYAIAAFLNEKSRNHYGFLGDV